MSLPPVAFYSIHEVSVCKGCSSADVAGWAAAGKLRVLIGIAHVKCGDEVFGGFVEVPMADLMLLFRRSGISAETCRLKRILPPGAPHWMRITDPVDGLQVRATDLMLPAEEVRAFFATERDRVTSPAKKGGASPRYRWDEMIVLLFKHLHEQGFPESQTALVAEVQDWFDTNARAHEVPEESTIRKRIAPIWQAVRGSD